MTTLDRYVSREWVKVFLLAALGFPFLAMWTPNLIFATAGLVGLWRIRKPGNAPHGGDWSDIFDLAVRVMHWPGSVLPPRRRSAP